MNSFDSIDDATPINDISGLIPMHIHSQKELNEWEENNIIYAVKKYLTKRKKIDITISWIKQIHKEMFDKTWEWAGVFRKNNFNLGVDYNQINIELKKLIDDIEYWKSHSNSMNWFEQSVRIHYRLVKIHPFPNGNGRHARLVSDIFLFNNNLTLPTWPTEEMIKQTQIRKEYITALKQADKGDISLLLKFTEKLLK